LESYDDNLNVLLEWVHDVHSEVCRENYSKTVT